MSAHTPGPWVADDSRYVGSINRLEEPAPRHVAMVSQFQVTATDQAENEANARLIAAAPELLKALERIAREHDCGCGPCAGSCRSKEALEITVEEIQEIARAATAKALAS